MVSPIKLESVNLILASISLSKYFSEFTTVESSKCIIRLLGIMLNSSKLKVISDISTVLFLSERVDCAKSTYGVNNKRINIFVKNFKLNFIGFW